MGKLIKGLLKPFRWVQFRLVRNRSVPRTLRAPLPSQSQETPASLASGGSNVAIYARDDTEVSSLWSPRTETMVTLPSYHTENTAAPQYSAEFSNANETVQETASYNGSNGDATAQTINDVVGASNDSPQPGYVQTYRISRFAENFDNSTSDSQGIVFEPGSESTPHPRITFSGRLASLLVEVMEGHQEQKQLRERLDEYKACNRDAKERLRAEIKRLNNLIEALSSASDSETREPMKTAIRTGRDHITFLEETCLVWETQVSSVREELASIETEQARQVRDFFDQACAAMDDGFTPDQEVREEDPEDIEQARLIDALCDRSCAAEDEDAFIRGEKGPETEAESEVPLSPMQNAISTNHPSSTSRLGSSSLLSLETLHRAVVFNKLEHTFQRVQELYSQINKHDYVDAFSDYVAELEKQGSLCPSLPRPTTEFDQNFLAQAMELNRQLTQAESAFKETKRHARLLGIDIRRYRTSTDVEREAAAAAAAADPAHGYTESFEAELSATVDRARIERWLGNTTEEGNDNHEEKYGNVNPKNAYAEYDYDSEEDWDTAGSVDISDSVSLRAFGSDRRRIDRWRDAAGRGGVL